MPSASASSAPDSAHSSSSWYQSFPDLARRDISMPSTSPTCPMVISVTSRWNPTRPAALDPDLPRSSSITSTREVCQPSPTARCTRAYCSRVDSPWSSTCWRVDWRTYTTASRARCRSQTLLPSRSHGNSAVMAALLHRPGPTRRSPPGLLLGAAPPPPGWPAPPATAPPPDGWPPAAPPSTAWSPPAGPGSSPVVHDPPSSPRARACSRSTTSTSRNSPSRPSIGVCPTWSAFMGAFCLADFDRPAAPGHPDQPHQGGVDRPVAGVEGQLAVAAAAPDQQPALPAAGGWWGQLDTGPVVQPSSFGAVAGAGPHPAFGRHRRGQLGGALLRRPITDRQQLAGLDRQHVGHLATLQPDPEGRVLAIDLIGGHP